MSKIGKKIITIPEGITAELHEGLLHVKGKRGELTLPMLPGIIGKINARVLSFKSPANNIQERANWGTMRALAANAIKGVSDGYTEILELQGIGFRALLEGNTLVLTVGFTHPVRFETPKNITITIEKSNITISGIDKALVGETAAKIRAIKKPEPYKGTGIRYKGEVVRKKEGKKVAGATGGTA